jgi:hypothetical protein
MEAESATDARLIGTATAGRSRAPANVWRADGIALLPTVLIGLIALAAALALGLADLRWRDLR